MPEPTVTRDQILDAAETLFARQGFSSTTIKELAHEAGVNSALLYYYFEDKETLYKAMISRVIEGLVSSIAGRIEGITDPTEGIRQFAAAQAETILARPVIPRLILRELLDHDARHAHEHLSTAVGRGLMPLAHLIESGQRAGRFRGDVNPRFGAISIVSQLMYFFVARPAVAVLLDAGEGPIPAETVRGFARHAGDFAVKALSI
jgi:TetR/AcrR family transcriptional regulator